ncbi:MAG: hypothetical protein NTX65_14960 [Ignavibacteriales bacterium]|nr:hypothetical protein [Ignavibacteriales bacterium]
MNKYKIKLEKEKQILALLYKDPEQSNELFEKVPLEMFTKENREIFEAISKQSPCDSIAILHQLQIRSYPVQEILDLSFQIESITERIKEFYDICETLNIENILAGALNESKTSFRGVDLLFEVKEKIDAGINKYSRFLTITTFDQNLPTILERIESKFTMDDSLKTKSFPSFNTGTGGLNEGNLLGIAGAFKNGKTTFGLNLILDFVEQNIPSAIFSLEMSNNEIEEKILSYKTGINYDKIRNPKRLNEEERVSLLRYSSQRKNSDEKLFIFDRAFTLSEIESNVKKLKDKYGLKVILIDYIGLIKSVSKNKNIDSREREIAQISSSLKLLAKETDTIIIVLSQLNRSGIKDASSVNLAESLGLARDSDFLFTISKPKEEDTTYFEVKLDSSRHTASGKEFLLRLNDNGKMEEIETRFDNSYLNNRGTLKLRKIHHGTQTNFFKK